MNKLVIRYTPSQLKKWIGIAAGIYLLGISASTMLVEMMNHDAASTMGYTPSFYFYGLGLLLSICVLLMYTVWESETDIVLDDERIWARMPKQKKLDTEWVRVSKVEIGTGYITFHLNGGVSTFRLALDTLQYRDVAPLIHFVVRQCEVKNIVCDK